MGVSPNLMPEQWSSFFVMVGGGAAALAIIVLFGFLTLPGMTYL